MNAPNADTELAFAVTEARAAELAAVPTLRFAIRVSDTTGVPIQSITLSTAIRIAPAKRRYSQQQAALLADLFGAPSRWVDTMRPLTWARVTTVVPAFTGEIVADLPVECGHDNELAVAKYFHAVRADEVPLQFLFSGTIFHTDRQGSLRTRRISWSSEAIFALPAEVWHDAVSGPHGHRWLRLSGDRFDALCAYRSRRGLTDWDAVVDALTAGEENGTAT
ncbi:DUF6084 family protein [Saccharopolyspora sp. SCSIO 74807]|uniref:DUF6084 family protein n=1 Tax=Saccharopolyspora sp. SCSIO 74807 TaxID=3118084 RepID=UPI0030D3A0A4